MISEGTDELAFNAAIEEAGNKAEVVLVFSGQGSSCYTRTGGRAIKVGGWGPILGDKGSAYQIGLRGLKAAVHYYDQDGVWPELGSRLLRRLQLNSPADLPNWAQRAGRMEICDLAAEVLAAWDGKDKVASQIVAAAANSLARDGAACARRARFKAPHFVLAGSVLKKHRRFAQAVTRCLRKLVPAATVAVLEKEGVWDGIGAAREAAPATAGPADSARAHSSEHDAPVTSRKTSPTEQRNPASTHLDRMPISRAIELMLSEDATIPGKLRRESSRIEQGVRAIVKAFSRGGRLFYVGAGTSGRLGVLDASECPPTFRTAPEQVQAIIAGGQTALWQSVEGAEDNVGAGADAIAFRQINRRDVVVGIAASGTTPFVWGALQESRRRGATTILICFNPWLDIPRASKPQIVIAPNLGPELLTGSTRLKAGTATKLILNMFTTLAMVQRGKVLSNLMVDLTPANAKLRDRAVRIVQELTGAEYARARVALERNGWTIKKAVAWLNRKRPPAV